MYDLFVTHDWRRNGDFDRANALIDSILGLGWRNYGNPWYDPSIHLSTPEGDALVRTRLEGQLTPAKAVILVPSIYLDSARGKSWVGLSLEIARRNRIPVIGLSDSTVPPSPELSTLVDRWVPWDAGALVAAVNEVTSPTNANVG